MVTSVRELLSASVRRLRGDARSRRAWALAKGLDLKMVERVEKLADRDRPVPAPSIEVLDDLAKACGVAPWQLLHPNPAVAGLSPEAIAAAAKLDEIQDHAKRRQAYALWRFVVEHGASLDEIVSTLSRETSRPTQEPAPQWETPRVRTP